MKSEAPLWNNYRISRPVDENDTRNPFYISTIILRKKLNKAWVRYEISEKDRRTTDFELQKFYDRWKSLLFRWRLLIVKYERHQLKIEHAESGLRLLRQNVRHVSGFTGMFKSKQILNKKSLFTRGV